MTPLAITSGEPAGIGPDICLQLGARPGGFQAVVLADPDVLQARSHQLGCQLDVQLWQPGQPAWLGDGQLHCYPVSAAARVRPGRLDPANGPHVLALLDAALAGIQRGEFSGLVTAPVQKSVIADSGVAFTGHTEYLQTAAGLDQVVMMLATRGLRVALVTTHLPLRAVADAITPERLTRVTRILHQSLQRDFGLAQPRILVCGLNPHAGENGHLGTEDRDIVQPTLDTLRQDGLDLTGPLPADTLFTDKVLSGSDAVLAMYHDQGLPVLKYKGFGRAVNITLGLPYVRTSVDHGTALDLAGSGQADSGSLQLALETAQQMVITRDTHERSRH